jgi:SpoVK/Ycf46/Vps4 family AAA+-type ATPase
MKTASRRAVAEEIYRHIAVDDYALFYLYTSEETKALEIIEMVAEDVETEEIYVFDIAAGLRARRDKRLKLLKDSQLKDILFVLDWITANEVNGFVVFLNPNPLFEQDPVFGRAFKNLVRNIKKRELPLKCFIISPLSQVPAEIAMESYFIDIPLPSREEIREIINNYLDRHGHKKIPEDLMERFVDALYGMRENDVTNCIRFSLYDDVLTEEDVQAILKLKYQLIRKEGILEFIIPTEGLEEIGGMTKLKAWVERKRKIFERLDAAVAQGVDVPKGMLLFGMPGCGKSLMAKVVARLFSMPLLRLDMGRVLGPYLGQSEENIRRAIKVSESIAPAVLWIDELEKAFAGVGGGGGSGEVMTRVFGSFLTWMQEKKKPVFVVATANDITRMPPEFMRKGRFDEIFFVDFPSKTAREEIFTIHLRKRKRESWRNLPSWDKWIEKTEGFSGADIEAVVKDVVEEDFIRNGQIDVEQTMDYVLSDFKPLSKTMPEKVEEIRKKCTELEAKTVE